MSIHPSLTATKGKKQRSVLKRYERIENSKKKANGKKIRPVLVYQK